MIGKEFINWGFNGQILIGNHDKVIIAVPFVFEYGVIRDVDWRNGKIVGGQFAKEVRFFDRYGEYSTTKFLEQLQNQS